MKDSIDTLITRTHQTFYSNGLWELMAGSILLSGGLLLQISPHGNTGVIVFAVCVLVIFFLYSLAKTKLVYPRSGYAVYIGQGIRAYIILLVKRALLLAALSAIFITLRDENEISAQTWLVFLLGIFIGIGWLWQGIRLQMLRLLILAIASISIGAILSPLNSWDAVQTMSAISRLSWYFVLLGVAFLASGGVTFWRYLRSTQPEGGETA